LTRTIRVVRSGGSIEQLKRCKPCLERSPCFFQASFLGCMESQAGEMPGLTTHQPQTAQFVVATPQRSVCDDNARALAQHGLLRFLALGTRRGTEGVPPEQTRLNPLIG